MGRRLTLSWLVCLTLVLGGCDLIPMDGGGGFSAASYLGQAPPELEVPAGNWLNPPTGLAARSLEGLRGRVVWLQFGFLG